VDRRILFIVWDDVPVVDQFGTVRQDLDKEGKMVYCNEWQKRGCPKLPCWPCRTCWQGRVFDEFVLEDGGPQRREDQE